VSVPKLDPGRAALVVIDIQEAFRKALPEFDQVTAASGVLIEGAKVVGIPIVVTEQYPKGLGHTVTEVAEHLPEGVQPDQALVCGIETHVCVNQSVLDLLDEGVEVHVARDAVGSRSEENWELGLHKVEQAGAVLTSVETALFELVRQSGTDQFKRVQKLILEFAPNPA
jgi:nicotinamidase-related amidase